MQNIPLPGSGNHIADAAYDDLQISSRCPRCDGSGKKYLTRGQLREYLEENLFSLREAIKIVAQWQEDGSIDCPLCEGSGKY